MCLSCGVCVCVCVCVSVYVVHRRLLLLILPLLLLLVLTVVMVVLLVVRMCLVLVFSLRDANTARKKEVTEDELAPYREWRMYVMTFACCRHTRSKITTTAGPA